MAAQTALLLDEVQQEETVGQDPRLYWSSYKPKVMFLRSALPSLPMPVRFYCD